MMSLSILVTILVVGALAGLVVIIALALLYRKGNEIDLTSPTSKPEWMRQPPAAETISATLADGEGVQVFDHDEGEQLASPFVEQIEDIVQARLAEHPELNQYRLDFGSAPDGSLEIHVNDQVFTEIDALPNEKLKTLIREAIETWHNAH